MECQHTRVYTRDGRVDLTVTNDCAHHVVNRLCLPSASSDPLIRSSFLLLCSFFFLLPSFYFVGPLPLLLSQTYESISMWNGMQLAAPSRYLTAMYLMVRPTAVSILCFYSHVLCFVLQSVRDSRACQAFWRRVPPWKDMES